MNRRTLFAVHAAAILCWFSGYGQVPVIGGWRDHLPYHQAIAVAADAGRIYCATPYSLFTVDRKENSIDRLSRTNGLSETGISAVCLDPGSSKLTIAYASSNIDVLSRQQTFNVPDIRLTRRLGDKTIYEATLIDGAVYLSTGMGIIVVDQDKYEIKDTYIIGIGGDSIPVRSVARDKDFLYAATGEGLKQVPATSPDPADFHNWTVAEPGACRQVLTLGGSVLFLRNDSIYRHTAASPELVYASAWHINNITASEDKLLVCEKSVNDARVSMLSPAGAVERTLQQPGALVDPRQAILVEGEPWVADAVTGLSAWGSAGVQPKSYIPDSPQGLATGPMTMYRDPAAAPGTPGVLWVASGGADTNWLALNNRNGLYRLDADGWKNYNSTGYPIFNNIYDFGAIGWNARDTSLYAGSFGQGLLVRQPQDRYTVYGAGSAVGSDMNDANAYRITGIAIDKDGNTWMSNYGASRELLLREANGTWTAFTIPFPHADNAVSQLLVDDFGQVWIVSPKGGGVFCFNPGGSPGNTSDDQWRSFGKGAGNGNLPESQVYCIAKDRSGFIWIGTANGVGVIQCPSQIFGANTCEAVWPVVQFDNFAGYLFGGQPVQAIAVDGADRKWIGTRNGVWLISPDARSIIYHFTSDSTPLLHNDVRNIAIDPVTGEVFFATAGGLCSFRSTATEGGQQNENVLVYPNPVPPDYTGTIAIRGLVDGAIVKISAPDGRLIYQTNALGGQAVWDGKDYRGRKAVTGVYIVLISDEARREKAAARIVFIGK